MATLDVNITSRLLCEELVGDLPLSHQFGERAYLSNVCVLPTARRQGFAEGILKAACCWSKEQCVKVGVCVEFIFQDIVIHTTYSHMLPCSIFIFSAAPVRTRCSR